MKGSSHVVLPTATAVAERWRFTLSCQSAAPPREGWMAAAVGRSGSIGLIPWPRYLMVGNPNYYMVHAEQRPPNSDPDPPDDGRGRGSSDNNDDEKDGLLDILVGKLRRTFRVKKPTADS